MKVKTLIASAVLALTAGWASAATADLGGISQNAAQPSYTLFSHTGLFADTIDFTVGAGTVQSSASALNLALGETNVFNIANLAYSVYSGTAASGGTLLGTYLGNNITNSLTIGSSGAYHLLVTGLANGVGGGNYAVSLVSSVPEPETYAMMLGGMALVGFVARRRQKRLS